MRLSDPGEARLRGGYFYNGKGAMSATYRLRRTAGKWKVLGTVGTVMKS